MSVNLLSNHCYRSKTAGSDASEAVKGEASVFCGFSNIDAQSSLELFQDLLCTPYIAGSAKANGNRMLAFWNHSEESVESNHTVNPAYRDVEFLGDDGLNLHRKVANSMLRLVKYVDKLARLVSEFIADSPNLFNDRVAQFFHIYSVLG